MAEIELVIKIDEEDYEIMQHNILVNNPLCPLSQEEMVSKVANGIPIPKGHGRLIDADALEKRMVDREIELNDDRALWESSAISVALDMFATTIVEADKK